MRFSVFIRGTALTASLLTGCNSGQSPGTLPVAQSPLIVAPVGQVREQSVLRSATAVVLVNAGGPASGSWRADTDYSGGWAAAAVSHAIDTSQVSNPAPAPVYHDNRIGNFTYTIPGLTAGATYTVRLHFAETYWTAAGKRVFNVSINGASVLSHFDIFADSGGEYVAVVKTFTASASSVGKITIVFSTLTDNALVSGVEVDAGGSPTPTPTLTPGMVPIVERQRAVCYTSGTTCTAALNARAVSGNMLLAIADGGQPTGGKIAGYSSAFQTYGGYLKSVGYYKVATGTESSIVIPTTAGFDTGAVLVEVSGVTGTPIFNGDAGNQILNTATHSLTSLAASVPSRGGYALGLFEVYLNAGTSYPESGVIASNGFAVDYDQVSKLSQAGRSEFVGIHKIYGTAASTSSTVVMPNNPVTGTNNQEYAPIVVLAGAGIQPSSTPNPTPSPSSIPSSTPPPSPTPTPLAANQVCVSGATYKTAQDDEFTNDTSLSFTNDQILATPPPGKQMWSTNSYLFGNRQRNNPSFDPSYYVNPGAGLFGGYNPFSLSSSLGLTITAEPVPSQYAGDPNLSATQPSATWLSGVLQGAALTYGYVEVSAEEPDTAGVFPAPLYIREEGSNSGPNGAPSLLEIDPNEVYGTAYGHDQIDQTVIWYPQGSGGATQTAFQAPSDIHSKFHTTGVLWTAGNPGKVTFYYDRVPYHTYAARSTGPMHPLITLQMFYPGSWGAPGGAYPLIPYTMNIKYFRWYQSTGSACSGEPRIPEPSASFPP